MARKKTTTRKSQPKASMVDQLIAASKRGPSGFQLNASVIADVDAVLNDPRIKSGEAYVSAAQMAKFLKDKHAIPLGLHTIARRVKEYADGAL